MTRIIFGSIYAVIFIIQMFFTNYENNSHIIGINFGLAFGFCFGILFGGGIIGIKNFILRLILYFNGFIPWNYARFLNYATELNFLHRVGGGYMFMHRLLLEHFAEMNLEKVKKPSGATK
ncbi:MAG: hypothetical protein V7K18_02050 [Nostoc sp.]|uniref:hypothetical protein n=1 Tax=Nostoc sp. TaxID=1180 RepID=UPI002FF86FF1